MSCNSITFQLASGLRLMLTRHVSGKASAFLFMGGQMLCCTSMAYEVRVEESYPTGLWLDNTCYDLPRQQLAEAAKLLGKHGAGAKDDVAQ